MVVCAQSGLNARPRVSGPSQITAATVTPAVAITTAMSVFRNGDIAMAESGVNRVAYVETPKTTQRGTK